jgi:hypothetical protein
VDRPTFAPNANFSQITGFDNRGFLPPYFPFGRGQDRVFGETVRYLRPDSVSLIHPWAALHLRLESTAAANRPHGKRKPSGYPGSLSFLPLEGHASCHAESALDRLASLAASYADLGSGSSKTLYSLYVERHLRDHAERLDGIERSLALCDNGDPAWVAWLQQRGAQARSAVEHEPDVTGSGETLDAWREAWLGFGQALRAWPTIRETARSLRIAQ